MKSKMSVALILAAGLILITLDIPISKSNIFFDPEPDLDCDGDLSWVYPEPGSTLTGTLTVENIGDAGSLLDWEIVEWPDWGTWTFTPSSGDDLTPEDGAVSVNVEAFYPGGPIYGEIKIVNCENPDDFCIISISTPPPPPAMKCIGFIRNLVITTYTITFDAIIVLVFQYSFPRLKINTQVNLHNSYGGYLSDHFVWATFYFY